MGDEGFPRLEALGVLLLLPGHPLPGHHLPLPHAAAPTILHCQRHHPMHALLLPDWPCLLSSYRLWYVDTDSIFFYSCHWDITQSHYAIDTLMCIDSKVT